MIIFGSKWMIYSCILSLTVGIAIVSPLLILNTQIDPFPENPQVYPNPQSQMGQIAVQVKNVQFELKFVKLVTGVNSTETTTLPIFNEKTTVSVTKYLNNESIPDAESDYILLHMYTENGTLIESRTMDVGTAYNQSFTRGQQYLLNSNQMIQNLTNYGGGAFFFKWSIGTTQTFNEGFGRDIEPDLAALIGSSQTLTLSLTRIGTVTVKDGIATASFTNAEHVENVTLTRSGNLFTYTR